MFNTKILLPISCCFILLLNSVSAQECTTLIEKLKKEAERLKVEKKKGEDEINRLKASMASRDSICEILSTKSSSNDILQREVDSLEKEIKHRDNRLISCQKQNDDAKLQYKKSLESLRKCYAQDGNETKQVIHNKNSYDCYIVDIRKSEIQFYWKDEKGKPLQSLAHLAQMIEKDKKKILIFGTNAGMYLSNNAPQGLFVALGKETTPIDRKTKDFGNFYLQPNGVFFITKDSVPKIQTTEQFTDDLISTTLFATQSGPMVVINGEINTKFKIGSDNLNIRSGVGIIDKNHVVFVISNQRVNFYDFAALFKEEFHCKEALYLDGAISEMYLPEAGRFDDGGNFGPIIGITKNQ